MNKNNVKKTLDNFLVVLLVGLILCTGILSLFASSIGTNVIVTQAPKEEEIEEEEEEEDVIEEEEEEEVGEIIEEEIIEEKEEEEEEEEEKMEEEKKDESKEKGEEGDSLLVGILGGLVNFFQNASIVSAKALQYATEQTIETLKNAPGQALEMRSNPEVKNATAKALTPTAIVGTIVISYIGTITIASSLANIYPLLAQFWGALMQYFGIKKKKRRWGVIYNSATKEPVDLAIVRLIDSKNNSVKQTVVTDKNGRFSFQPIIGRFHITVTKPSFTFPSKLVRGVTNDGKYRDLYFGKNVKISEGQTLGFSIPIDPSYTMKAHVSFFDRIRSLLEKMSTPVLLFGIAFSIVILWINTNLLNGAILAIYIILFALKEMLLKSPTKPWGKVFDAKNKKPISGIVIRLFDQKYDKLVETKITDKKGNFNFLLPEGKYYIKITSNRYKIASKKKVKFKHGYYGDIFEIKKKRTIHINIPLTKTRTISEKIKLPVQKVKTSILKPDSIFDYLDQKGKSVSELFREIK